MTNSPTHREKSKEQRDNTKTPPKFDYTTILDRLRAVSWSNDNHKTGAVKQVNGIPTFQLT